jgi:hypothetical protein
MSRYVALVCPARKGGIMRFGKKHLRRQFGAIDMEELAANLYRLYHDDPAASLGDLQDRDVRDDAVVKSTLRMAYYLCDLAEVDAERGIGTAYYR